MKTINRFLFLATMIMPALSMAENANCDCHCHHKGQSSVFISYSNAATNADLHDSPMINLGFNHDPNFKPFTMDTGSCGIVASPDMFTIGPDSRALGSGETHYTDGTFNKDLFGTYYTATQQLYDANGVLQATSHVPVLLVTSESDNGGPFFTPSNFALMGIGFGREGNDLPPKTPMLNAFLNLTSIRKDGKLEHLPKDWVNGYIISAEGAELGLTAKNTKHAGFIKLTKWVQYSTHSLPEWMPMSMTVCINGACGDGTSVMDTGIGGGIIMPPPGVILPLVKCEPSDTAPNCIPDGNVFSIYYPNKDNPVAFYTFTTGQTGNPMEPERVAEQTRPGTYWNTSRHFLGGMNFVYDNTHGYAGFIWNHKASNNVGFVIPTKEKQESGSGKH